MPRRHLTAISLFTGVGGLDFGFEAAGFDTVAAVELDPVACRTLRMNRPSWNVLEGDIHQITSRTILESAGLAPGDADVLIGGPPCQPFSKSSYWVSGDSLRLNDERADTLTAYLRVLRDTKPKAFLIENVYGLAYKGKDEGLRHILDGVAQINRETGSNYSISWRMLNAAHFGVPQIRERVFLVGIRDGTEFCFPNPTHSSSEERQSFESLQPYRTAWDAIGDLQQAPEEPSLKVGGKWGDLLPTIPEGQNYLWHTRRGGGEQLFGWRTRYWSFLLKLAKSQPSWTIQAQPGSAIGPFHWCNRKLTIAEMGRIQTFPDGLLKACSRTDAQRLIGNAVPSLLAEVLAREIRRQTLHDNSDLGSLQSIPPRRIPIPPPEPIQTIPETFREMIGNYPDHPGEGRLSGKRATKSAKIQQKMFDLL